MNTQRWAMCAVALAAVAVAPASAEVRTETVEYTVQGQAMQGFLAYDDALSGARPGVLVVHEWWGLNDFIKDKTRALAELGYVAFAADMYGNGRTTTERNQASEWAGALRGTPAMRQRARAALDVLSERPNVDRRRLAAIGFCFGGTTVLELAYSGSDLRGVVSFHGGLTVPGADDPKIRPEILVLHGAADASVPAADVQKLQQALEQRGADWTLIVYAHARHGFTNPAAGRDGAGPPAYDERAARQSWQHMRLFLREVFGEGDPLDTPQDTGRRTLDELLRDIERFQRESGGTTDQQDPRRFEEEVKKRLGQ